MRRTIATTHAHCTCALAARACAAALLSLVAAGAALGQAAAADPEADPAVESGLRESVDVRIVQVDLSIVEKDGLRSVPGITLDQLDIRIDGRGIDRAVREGSSLDYICDEASAPAETIDDELRTFAARPVLAMIDFNYLDAPGRFRVAAALDELAEQAGKSRDVFKIYGYTRQLRRLSLGFTRDPAELRRVAAVVRSQSFSSKPALGRGEFAIPGVSDSGFTDSGVRGEADIPGQAPVDASFEEFGRYARSSLAGDGSAVPDAGAVLDTVEENFAALRAEIALTSDGADALSEYRPSASLGALETILRAHATLPGRKAVILFTSEAFSYADRARADQETRAVKDLARRGFSIWTVDVEGLARQGSGILVSSLAAETGGRSVRRTGRLVAAFEGVREQLSCYYLLSLPVRADAGETIRRNLLVKLDTDRFPDLWGYRVTSPSELIVLDRKAMQLEEHVAALVTPDDFDEIPVVTTLDYPLASDEGERERLPVRLRIPLGSLEWQPEGEVFAASVLVDALVERDTGSGVRVLRTVEREGEGRRIDIRLPRPPRAGEPVGLQIELSAPFERDGLYTARAAITDLFSGLTGAGRSTVWVSRRGSDSWRVHAPRVETLPAAVSRRDLIWTRGGGPREPGRIERDTAGVTWRVVTDGLPARTGDFLSLSYVLCGPDPSGASAAFRPFVARARDSGELDVELWLAADDVRLSQMPEQGRFCAAAVALVDKAELYEPGEYVFGLAAVEDGAEGADSGGAEQGRAVESATGLGELAAAVPFRLR